MSLGIELSPPGNGSQRVTLSGRLDTHTYEDLDEALAPLLTRHLQSLVLDLAALEYISSAGLRSILAATKKLKAQDGSLALCSLSGLVEEVVPESGFDNILQVFADLDQAMKEA